MSDHKRLLQERSNRGTLRGADQVLAAARLDPRSIPRFAVFFTGQPWIAAAISFAAVLSVGALVGTLIANPDASLPVVTSPGPATTTPIVTNRCETPPDQELRGGSMPAAISPAAASAGDTVELTMSLPTLHEEQGDRLHVDVVIWSCWDGSRWINLHRLAAASPIGPLVSVVQDPRPSHHIILPATIPLVVPDVEPGVYRIWFRARMSLEGVSLSASGQTHIEITSPSGP